MAGNNHYANCTCPWCIGGYGGGQNNAGIAATLPPAGTHSTWDSGDFCRPTNCPLCGAEVYFVRHNGGSVWFDELGPPWPKHSCFDDDYHGSELRATLIEESKQAPNPVFGVVIETEVIGPGKTGRIVMRCSDGTIIDDTFDTELNLTHLIGGLVLIDRADDGSFSFRCIDPPSPFRWRIRLRLSEGARITFEGRVYIWSGRYWCGADDYTIAPTGLQQRLNTYAKEQLRRADEDIP